MKIHPTHTLLPDTDGTIIAAGPLAGGDGTLFHRIVLRRFPNGSYVVHTQMYPDANTVAPSPSEEYEHGYYLWDEIAAFAKFIERLTAQKDFITQ